MPQVATPGAQVTRRTFHIVWWACAASLGLFAAILLVAASRRAGQPLTGTIGEEAALVVAAFVVLAAVTSLRLMQRLPEADHPIFDTAGEPFERAAGSLFTLFVLSGGAAEAAGMASPVLLFLRAPAAMALLPLLLSAILLLRLRRRIAPLLHYLT